MLTLDNEQDMLYALKEAKGTVKRLEAELSDAKKEYDRLEGMLIAWLDDHGGAKKTREYPGLGHATIRKPSYYASCLEEDKPRLFEFLRSVGREDMVKETVHPRSLSAFVKECIEEGTNPLPEFVKYHLVRKLLIY